MAEEGGWDWEIDPRGVEARRCPRGQEDVRRSTPAGPHRQDPRPSAATSKRLARPWKELDRGLALPAICSIERDCTSDWCAKVVTQVLSAAGAEGHGLSSPLLLQLANGSAQHASNTSIFSTCVGQREITANFAFQKT
ncbi:hypothetical protein POX_b02412 [Penicillium oxalicum]|uniref:hypothetical protein n=1 Tax=Penicillium oxalicum TaxID=69781 RepID=UPI0020B69A65|nr:hypothetical protein POX_b02412 [Penicillium oxalicum]KAI2792375.1 hypothetical protein POX_b02412 [Penicillium oxalicum]